MEEANFEFQEEEEAIIRVAAFHCQDYDQAVICSEPHKHDPVLPSIVELFPTSSACETSVRGRLPIELIFAVCLLLDVRSCFRLRQANRRARCIVSSLNEYRAVATHGLEALRAALRTGIASRLTITDLYQPLCTRDCVICGSFGGFLFLPTATLCCFACIGNAHRLHVVSLSAISKASWIPRRQLRGMLPVLHILPGTYSIEKKRCYGLAHLVGREQAIAFLRSIRYYIDASIPSHPLGRYAASTALPYLDRATSRIENGLSCKGCRITAEENYFGVEEFCDQVYSRAAYLHHFRFCTGAKRLWDDSRGGSVATKEPVLTWRGGRIWF